MKFVKRTMLAVTLLLSTAVMAQHTKKVPATSVKTLEGVSFNTENIKNDGKPVLISFWATWCKPCIAELNAIGENYEDWRAETGVKVVAISIDDIRNSAKVAPFVNSRNWSFDVYLDPNGDFKRAMNVNNVPHSFLINANGEIVSQHNSYAPGDEDKLLEEIKELSKN